jgi:hypothetical protein
VRRLTVERWFLLATLAAGIVLVLWTLPYNGVGIFDLFMYGYPVLQVLALVRARGRTRLAAAAPLLFMVPVYGVTAWALVLKSNLAGVLLMMLSPVAFAITVVIFLRQDTAPTAQTSKPAAA